LAALCVAVALLLFWQLRSLLTGREEASSLRSQSEQLRAENSRLETGEATSADLEQLRKDQDERLRLRSEIDSLKTELAAMPPPVRPTAPPPAATGPATNLPLVFTKVRAQVEVDLSEGQTLVTGGWQTGPGIRQLLFVTPSVAGASGEQVSVSASFIEAPEAVLAQLALALSEIAGQESSLKEVFSSARTQEILEQLKATEGVKFLSQPRLLTLRDEEASFSVTEPITVEGEPQRLGPTIKISTTASDDGHGLKLRVGAEVGILKPN
jgi:hypothetical protein